MGGNNRVMLQTMDEVAFRKPVKIGHVLCLCSQVCLVIEHKQNTQKVFVSVSAHDSQDRKITNEFYFVFNVTTRPGQRPIPHVYPETYEEGLRIAHAHRRYKERFESLDVFNVSSIIKSQ